MIPVVQTKSASDDVASAFEDFARAFEAFKDANDTRLSQIETRLSGDVVTDEKPTVQILKPGRDYRATNIEEVPVGVKAQDDFKLRALVEIMQERLAKRNVPLMP